MQNLNFPVFSSSDLGDVSLEVLSKNCIDRVAHLTSAANTESKSGFNYHDSNAFWMTAVVCACHPRFESIWFAGESALYKSKIPTPSKVTTETQQQGLLLLFRNIIAHRNSIAPGTFSNWIPRTEMPAEAVAALENDTSPSLDVADRVVECPFSAVLPLIEDRLVVPVRGRVFVRPTAEIVRKLAIGAHDAFLRRVRAKFLAMAPAAAASDDRIGYIAAAVARSLSGDVYADARVSADLTPAAIAAAASARMLPPCAHALWAGLHRRHHLYHPERFQLQSFLKGIGAPLESTMAICEDAFVSGGKITHDRFKREYAYNIRHIYGLEGSRRSMSSIGCQRVRTNRTGRAGPHADGCPFHYMDSVVLKDWIEAEYGVHASEIGLKVDHTRDIEDANGMVDSCAMLCDLLVKKDALAHDRAADVEIDRPSHPCQWFRTRRDMHLALERPQAKQVPIGQLPPPRPAPK